MNCERRNPTFARPRRLLFPGVHRRLAALGPRPQGGAIPQGPAGRGKMRVRFDGRESVLVHERGGAPSAAPVRP